jgi:small redox-active disulfide protein 2
MQIQILGPGCANCVTLERRVQESLARLGVTDAEVGKVTDYGEIAAYGVMKTPGLVIDGAVAVSGRVPEVDEVDELLAAAR